MRRGGVAWAPLRGKLDETDGRTGWGMEVMEGPCRWRVKATSKFKRAGEGFVRRWIGLGIMCEPARAFASRPGRAVKGIIFTRNTVLKSLSMRS